MQKINIYEHVITHIDGDDTMKQWSKFEVNLIHRKLDFIRNLNMFSQATFF